MGKGWFGTTDYDQMAATITHEIGHNLGMWHDFQPGRHEGKGCQGFMDYDGNTGWSECSVSDLKEYLAYNNCLTKKQGTHCANKESDADCNEWKNDGDCTSWWWGAWMKDKCEKACGYCQGNWRPNEFVCHTMNIEWERIYFEEITKYLDVNTDYSSQEVIKYNGLFFSLLLLCFLWYLRFNNKKSKCNKSIRYYDYIWTIRHFTAF